MQIDIEDNRRGIGRIGLYAMALLLLLGALAVGLTGCGGGGSNPGNNGTPVTVTGRVLRAETGLAPNPGATVNIGGVSVTTGTDGTFSFTPPNSAKTATITATGTQTRTIAIALSATQPNNLGDIYISDTGYTATVTGRVVATVNGTNTGVGNATVTIANVSTTTAADGSFTLNGLPIDLGNVAGTVGSVTAAGFETKPITDVNLQFPLKAGSNPIGDLLIAAPSGSTPLPPFTVKGVVDVGGQPLANAPVTLMTTVNGVATTIGSTSTDATGTYTFWVTPAPYTVQATNGSAKKTTTVNLIRLDQPVTAPIINF